MPSVNYFNQYLPSVNYFNQYLPSVNYFNQYLPIVLVPRGTSGMSEVKNPCYSWLFN